MASKDDDTELEGLPPGQRSIKRLLRWGKDHPTIGGPVPRIDLRKWVPAINGEVKKPLRLSWDDLQGLPAVESVSDFHCVEGWSVPDLRWEGIRFKDVVSMVEPKEAAKFVSIECGLMGSILKRVLVLLFDWLFRINTPTKVRCGLRE